MKKESVLLAASVLLTLGAGCATDSQYVDASDTTIAVKNNDRMSSSDWVIIAQDAGNAMLTSRNFADFLSDYATDAEQNLKNAATTASQRRNARKPLLMLSTIRNDTSEHIDSKLMTERLREILFNSGKVRFTTYAAGDGQAIDTATAGVRQLRNDPNVNKATVAKRGGVNAYDLSLSGTIVKQTAQSGRNNEISYLFSLQLTDNRTGEGVWTYTKEIKRQYKQGGIGW